MKYSRVLTATPQRTQSDPRQVQNRAGGWIYPVTKKEQLRRFLMLGSADGSYYASGRELTKENLRVLDGLIREDGGYVVEQINLVSMSGRAPRNDACIFALAYVLKTAPDPDVRRLAANTVSNVCRTAAHLFQFAQAVKLFGGWGRITRRAVADWFDRDVDSLAYQAVKYRQREGWSLRDLLRLAHPTPDTDNGRVYQWILGKPFAGEVPPAILGYAKVQAATKPATVAGLVKQYRLPWEAVPTAYARDVDVQQALLDSMPATALIRQLGRLSSIGGLDLAPAVRKLEDHRWLERSRIHPMSLWLAMRQYATGHGGKGKLRWQVDEDVLHALESAFEASFKVGASMGQRLAIGVDCSGSMSHGAVGDIEGMTPVEAAAVMAWVLYRMNPSSSVIAFDTRPEDVTAAYSLARTPTEAWRIMQDRLGGGTDCAQPITWACQHRSDVDAFVILTDNETWAGPAHVTQALAYYRQVWGRPARMVTMDLVAHGYGIGDMERDAGTLRIVGLDSAAPQLMQDFVAREMESAAKQAA